MDQTITLIILSYTIGFLFLLAIRSYDKYDKEPLGRLVWFSFIGGLVSIGVASFIYLFVHPKMNLFDAIFKVGTVEELAKLITLAGLYRIIRKEYDEIVDGIIYMAAISLGFSVVENVFYIVSAPHPYILLLQRSLFATLGHIAFSVYMGIAFYVHKRVKKNYLGILIAYIIAVLAHGLYDGFIFDNRLTTLFFPTYLLIIYFEFRLLKVALAYSKYKKSLLKSNYKLLQKDTQNYCCNCSQSDTDDHLFDNRIKLSSCNNCGNIILDTKNFKSLLKYFRPKLNRKKYFNYLQSESDKQFIDTEKTNIYFASRDRLNANKAVLQAWLENENKSDLQRYHKSIEGFIFKWIGFGKIRQ